MRLLVLAPARLGDFQAQVLESLFSSDGVEVVGAVIDRRRRPGPLARLGNHLRKGRGGYVLVLAGQRLVGRCLRRSREVSAQRFLDGRGPATCPTDDLYSPATLDFIRDRRPDCIFRAGFGIIREPVLSAAPRGVISFHHGDLRKYRGLPPAFWELYHGEREMRVAVQQLAEQIDAGRIVCQAVVPIAAGDSWGSLRRRAYAASVPMIAEACRRLADPAFQPTPIPPDQLGPLHTMPNLRQWLTLQWRVLRRKLTGVNHSR